MDYLTPVDHTVLLALAAGLFGGTMTGSIDAGLAYWMEKGSWQGWEAMLRSTVLYAIIFGLILSAGAFVLLLYAPAKPLVEIDQLFVKSGIGLSVIVPCINQLRRLV
ncbi:MAG: hypothetical protein ABG776_21890 [Cyanobacteria bacterium J06555_13]